MLRVITTVLISASLLSGLARADSLVVYDFNQVANGSDSSNATVSTPVLVAGDLELVGLEQGLYSKGGADGTKFRGFSGWDSVYSFAQQGDGWSESSDVLAFEITLDPGCELDFDSLSFDWYRPFAESVANAQAAIIWQDALGEICYATSAIATLDGVGQWGHENLEFSWQDGAAPEALPGSSYRVELYAWGNGGNVLMTDNIALNGSTNFIPVPEPGSALLAAMAGAVLTWRRRRR